MRVPAALLIALPFIAASKSSSSEEGLVTRQSGWPGCQQDLSCSFADIQGSSMQERLDYVQFMQSEFFGPLNANNQFRPIEGVITFFVNNDLGHPDSWISYVDTGIIEAIQNGGAIALGISTNTGGNPGSIKWAGFFETMQAGGYGSRDDHDYAWGDAEATATEWAKATQADVYADAPATQQELNWYQFTNVYRWIMRNEAETILLLTPIFLFYSDDFVLWLTDVTRPEPTICGSEAAWAVSDVSLSFDSLVSLPTDIVDLLEAIYNCGKDFIENS